jgi:glycosyltransferase involved in cell wall biosynthesis
MPSERPAPLVSAVIPTFNRLAYLRAAIDSVLNQTLGDFEIIVHDNASAEDPTPMVAAIGDPRIWVHRNATNIGQTGNIVAACTKARGKYVAILGDDDLWQPNFLATLVPPMQEDPDIVVAFCAHDVIDEQGRLDAARTEAVNRRHRDGISQGVHGPFVSIALIRRAICVVSGAVFRRDAVEWQAVPKDLVFNCDVYISYLAVRTGKRCYYHPDRLSQSRFMEGSASVEITASMRATEKTARAALGYWDTFFRDSAVADGRRYFAMKRADNALRIILCGLRIRGWGAALREFGAFLRDGVIRPRALLYHFRYGLH